MISAKPPEGRIEKRKFEINVTYMGFERKVDGRLSLYNAPANRSQSRREPLKDHFAKRFRNLVEPM